MVKQIPTKAEFDATLSGAGGKVRRVPRVTCSAYCELYMLPDMCTRVMMSVPRTPARVRRLHRNLVRPLPAHRPGIREDVAGIHGLCLHQG